MGMQHRFVLVWPLIMVFVYEDDPSMLPLHAIKRNQIDPSAAMYSLGARQIDSHKQGTGYGSQALGLYDPLKYRYSGRQNNAHYRQHYQQFD